MEAALELGITYIAHTIVTFQGGRVANRSLQQQRIVSRITSTIYVH